MTTVSGSMTFLLAAGIAEVGPLFGQVGAEVFAGDGAGSSLFDARAMLGRYAPHAVLPL